jgi:endoglucanase
VRDVILAGMLRIFLGLTLAVSVFAQYRRGVDISGAEFGNNSIPGTLGHDYTFESESTFQYFGNKGLGLMRFAVLWERLQPTPSGPLDPTYLANLKQVIGWAKAHGGSIILDIHNYGRYSFNSSGGVQTYIVDNAGADGSVRITRNDLADLWRRLSSEFKFEGTVYGYDLMNEPHDMAGGNWKTISHAAVDAIRANQDDKLILVPGDSWSSGNRWLQVNGPTSWIQDPANNFAYEAHVYFDSDESGTYAKSYDTELAANPNLAMVGQTRVSHFISWCATNKVRGIVDEYGIPGNEPRWNTVLDNFFTALDAAQMDGAYWAAGEWWGNYPLSVQPANNFTVDRPQLPELLAHVGGGYLTALSAASVSVARSTSGSLVTVYGSGFTDQTATPLTVPYPASLGNVSVQITDSSGATASAGLVYISPNQISLEMPAGLALGRATITVVTDGSTRASGGIQVAAAGPGIFTANSAGYGLAAARWRFSSLGSLLSLAIFSSLRRTEGLKTSPDNFCARPSCSHAGQRPIIERQACVLSCAKMRSSAASMP